MGLFKRKETKPQEYTEENRRKLAGFNVTKAWGIKKYASAMQFVYDGDKRQCGLKLMNIGPKAKASMIRSHSIRTLLRINIRTYTGDMISI